ncbi:hypothetical protein BKA70DRAFT_1270717 [Coprinopsis sp. MPI-PUGE-AT-0042]|nr:hypothetical protein BKA70DRAFT_1270717 [Coprinopsis sp. MPI-PUGE-AT-0042]
MSVITFAFVSSASLWWMWGSLWRLSLPLCEAEGLEFRSGVRRQNSFARAPSLAPWRCSRCSSTIVLRPFFHQLAKPLILLFM